MGTVPEFIFNIFSLSCSQIPDHIPKPDYYSMDGTPVSEQNSRQQNQGEALAPHLTHGTS